MPISNFEPAFIAPSAVVEEGAMISNGVKVWHFSQIRRNSIIGENVIIGKSCFVDENVIIGKNTKVQNSCQIYSPAVIGVGVFIGPGVIFTNDLYPRAVNLDGTTKTKDDWESVGCTIGDGASIGAGSVIISTEVGKWAMVGAGSTVTEPVLPHSLVVGSPAKQIGWVCFCGLRNEKTCEKCGWRENDSDYES